MFPHWCNRFAKSSEPPTEQCFLGTAFNIPNQRNACPPPCNRVQSIFQRNDSKGPCDNRNATLTFFINSYWSCVRPYILVFLTISVCALRAQNSVGETPNPVIPVEDKRAYGVLPNYRTAEASSPFKALTTKQKLT